MLALGLNALGVAPVAEPLAAVGSSLQEGISQLRDIFPSGSAGTFGTGGAPLRAQLGQLNLNAFLPGDQAAQSAADLAALDVPDAPSGLINGTGELVNDEEARVLAAQPSFVLGASDGGPALGSLAPNTLQVPPMRHSSRRRRERRRASNFCWTELDAKHVGIVQSLIVTCRLHGIDVYTCLVDALQRISEHPASRVAELAPRLWKLYFAANPLHSPLHDLAA